MLPHALEMLPQHLNMLSRSLKLLGGSNTPNTRLGDLGHHFGLSKLEARRTNAVGSLVAVYNSSVEALSTVLTQPPFVELLTGLDQGDIDKARARELLNTVCAHEQTPTLSKHYALCKTLSGSLITIAGEEGVTFTDEQSTIAKICQETFRKLTPVSSSVCGMISLWRKTAEWENRVTICSHTLTAVAGEGCHVAILKLLTGASQGRATYAK